MKDTLQRIAVVDAGEMPEDVLRWCDINHVSTHYQHDIAYVENNDNPFAKWLLSLGYQFENEEGDQIGILST